MNPRPSLAQCLVLHDVADDGVWFDITSGRWHSTHVRNDVTTQVEILHRDGFVAIDSTQLHSSIQITDRGHQVLQRRPLLDLLERLNSR